LHIGPELDDRLDFRAPQKPPYFAKRPDRQWRWAYLQEITS